LELNNTVAAICELTRQEDGLTSGTNAHTFATLIQQELDPLWEPVRDQDDGDIESQLRARLNR